jgi:RNA polymerase sigma-70 factor (ECF subfamily)
MDRMASARGDAELLSLVRGAERDAAAALLYDRFCGDVNRLVWRLLGADGEHDDIVQQVFLHLLAGVARVRDEAALPAWVAAVCVKTVRSEIRRRRVRRFFQLGAGARSQTVATPVEDYEARDLLERTYTVLEAMPANERIAFVLRYAEERALVDVAAACGCSLATIKRRLQRAERRFVRLSARHPALAERLARGRWRQHDAA